jgi:phosphoglycerol transferase MdoB-like AlkP superfamily enzyme
MLQITFFKIPKRFQLLKTFAITFITFSFIVRVLLYFLSFQYIDFSLTNLFKIFGIGFCYDIGALSYFLFAYVLYLLLIPQKKIGCKLDRIATKFFYGFFLFLIIFSFLAEIPFWREYQRRYNFIAVDYLLYTYEVIENIHQSFPLPALMMIIVLLVIISVIFAKKQNAYKNTFENTDGFLVKIIPSSIIIIFFSIFHFYVYNVQAEIFDNINENEIAKSGLYSFFAAYKSNELNFNEFYETLSDEENYTIVRNAIKAKNDLLINSKNTISRYTSNTGEEKKPNVIFIGLESMSASFLKRYGNTQNLTPTIDALHKQSVAFTNMFATGTRTIRGIEAISLSIPPTPGRSIVKRKNNANLFTIGEVFKQKGYSRTFLYGGDADFDNMLNYFSTNGFNIVDRKKWHRLDREIPTERNRINDNEVSFENAWASCDGDLFKKLLRVADQQHLNKQPFFNFVMTSSNHPPYTFPEGVIDSNEKTRNNAVKYSDKALENFFIKAEKKPWFKNTVFVIVSDHCSYSAGRSEINIKNHHIPAFIYNLKDEIPGEVKKLSSQIDIFPTLFGYLNWSYTNNLFGKDITQMSPKEERAFIGNHRKVALLKKNQLTVLETQKKHASYLWNKEKNTLKTIKTDAILLEETISYYQTAFELFKGGKIKIK